MSWIARPWSRFVCFIKDSGLHFALYPFLFILYAILSPLLNNLEALEPTQVLRPLIVLLLGVAAGLLGLRLALKDGAYASYLVFLALAFIFVFGHLNRVLHDWLPVYQERASLLFLAGWTALFLFLGLPRTWRRFGGARRLTPLLNFILAIALLVQVIGSLDIVNKFRLRGELPSNAELAVLPLTGDEIRLDCSSAPDIYYIILDGYGRADVLEELYGVDNSDFLAFLESRGFFVAQESSANYIQTVLSIPSALNFEYLTPEPRNVSGREFFIELINENRLVKALEKCGYLTFSMETGFFFTDHLDVDVTLSSGLPLTEFENLLLAGTPLDLLIDVFGHRSSQQSYLAHRQRVLFSFDRLAELASQPGPKFVFAHIISPHPPFIFGAQGEPLQPAYSYTMFDGDEYRGNWDEYRLGYAAQVQFVNHKLKETIEAILAGSETPPVIVLQGDHGPGGALDWGSPDRTCLLERTSILNAYYLPGEVGSQLYPSISPVNTFRLILNAYLAARLNLLPDRTYFTSHRLPRQFIDVTARRDSTQNCPPAIRNVP